MVLRAQVSINVLKFDGYKISANLLLSGTHALGQTKLSLPGRNHWGFAIINR